MSSFMEVGSGYPSIPASPRHDDKWGESDASYGGIGDLPLLGKRRNFKDLQVSRSHKHYGSTIYKHLQNVQPYQLTLLKKSDCRINDQILPAIGQELIDPKIFPMGDDGEKVPYFSHRSKFEVFPEINHERIHNGTPVISRNARVSLKEIHNNLYKTTSYDENYSGPTDVNCKDNDDYVSVINSKKYEKAFLQKTEKQNLSPQSLPQSVIDQLMLAVAMADLNRLRRLLIDLKDVANHGSSNYMSQTYGSSPPNDLIVKMLAILAKDIPSETKFNSVRRILQSLDKKSDTTSDIKMPDINQKSQDGNEIRGRGFCWPPGDFYYIDHHTMQIKDKQSFDDKNQDKFEEYLSDQEVRSHLSKHLKREHKKKSAKLDRHTYETETESDSQSALVDWYRKICNRVPCSRADFDDGNGRLSLPTLASTLYPSGNRIQDRVGLRFRSEAHKRYHALYPDLVPDLRKSHVTTRRYFFGGFHSSAFR